MTHPAPTGGDERPDPFAVTETPPLATPPAAAYDSTELLEPTPAYDSLAQETAVSAPATEDLAPEADYGLAPNPGTAGPLGQVKAFAADKPAVFLGLALAAGWLVGKIFSSDDDD